MAPPRYRSSIPAIARERVVEEWPNGIKKRAEYFVKGRMVGIRGFFENGELEFDWPRRKGRPHGRQYFWIAPGKLGSVEPYENGLAHGVAKQWSANGKLIGIYRMRHGTGIDLWRRERDDGSVFLSEVLYLRKGLPAGFQWGINEDQETVHLERHYNGKGELHGISREWNRTGRLRRGFPKYYLNNQAVSKQRYLLACKNDSSLPRLRREDDQPKRAFPREIVTKLRRPRKKWTG